MSKTLYVLYRDYEGDESREHDIVEPVTDVSGEIVGWKSHITGLHEPRFSDDRIAPLPSLPTSFTLPNEPAPPEASFALEYYDESAEVKPTQARVVQVPFGLEIYVPGFGQHDMQDGQGAPIFLELGDKGQPVLHVWPNINESDPQTIDMAGAAESARHAEPQFQVGQRVYRKADAFDVGTVRRLSTDKRGAHWYYIDWQHAGSENTGRVEHELRAAE